MNWAERLLHREQAEQQLEKELRFHIEQMAEDLIAQGHTPGQARRQARLTLGGPEQVKEECRDARGTRWLEDFLYDVRYAFRLLRNKPGFSVVALLTLALGVGATTVMFTLVNGVLLKPLPFHDPDRLVFLQERTERATQFGNLWAFSYPNYLDVKSQVQSLDLAVMARSTGGVISIAGQAEFVDGFEVSSDLFKILGVKPVRGRDFLPQEDQRGAAPVALISTNLWQKLYGGSSSAIGSSFIFNEKPMTVVGIMPSNLEFGRGIGNQDADFYTLLGQDTEPVLQQRDRHPGIFGFARLHSGVTLAQAGNELDVIGRRLAQQYPASNQGRTFIATPLKADVGDTRSTLWLLLGAVGLVLLIACVNVASLLLARAVSRERELAVRVALGAGRGRVIRQCLTESAVLALLGGGLGVLLASLGTRPFITFWPGGLPRADQVQLDWRVLLASVGVALLCGLLFGLAPAMRVPARQLELVLKTGGRSAAGSSRRLHGAFVIAEVALAMVLLVAAGVLGRAILRLSSLDTGVKIHNVLTTRAALAPSALANPDHTRAAWRELLDHARAVPGVQAVAMVDTVPLREGNNPIGYRTTPVEDQEDRLPQALANSVTPDYLNVMGIPLRSGRFFTEQDKLGSEGVAVIDELMAQQAFPNQDPIGKHLWIGLGSDPARVVGVVGHVRYWGAGDDQASVRAQLYYPFAQVPDRLVRRWSQLMSVAVRTQVDPASVVEPLRQAVRGDAGNQALYEVRTMEQLARASLGLQRFLLLLFTIFAGLALLLACIGVYGVLAYLTNQRIPEIGTRMALGANAERVMRMVLGQSFKMIAAGAVFGILGAWAAARVLERLVEGVRSAGVMTFAVMAALLLLAGLAASFIPAYRASHVDPVKALRQE